MRSALILLDLNKPGPFLREPSKTIEVWGFGQVILLIPASPCLRFGRTPRGSAKVGAKRNKFERSDSAARARAAKARRSINSWSCNGLFSPGNSLQRVRRHVQAFSFCTLSDPANQLPTSPTWAGPTATGRLHCSIHNFLRVAHATLDCKRALLVSRRKRNFLRLSADSIWNKRPRPVESGQICGKPG